jgi:hypothetical protein
MGSTTRLNQVALTAILDRQLDVITRGQAHRAGLTDGALRHRLRPGGPWQMLLPTVYIATTGEPSIAQQQIAAQLYGGPRSVITGTAAVLSHGIRAEQSELIDVLVPLTRQRRNVGFALLHRTSRMPEQVYNFGPIRFALAPRAVADTVRGLTSLRDVRAIVADAVQRRKCGIEELGIELKAGPNVGSAFFREALGDVAAGIHSAAEGDFKDLLAKSRLPAPLFNASIYDSDGAFVARPDAWWPQYSVAVQIDSHEWHLSPHDHTRTLERQRRMAKLGILVLPFTPRQIRTERAETLAAIREALDSGRPVANLRTVAA